MNLLRGGILDVVASTIGQMSSPISRFKPMTRDIHKGRSTTDLLKQANSQGAAKLAEMLVLIIQIAAGQIVDVIFTKRMSFADSQDPYLHNFVLECILCLRLCVMQHHCLVILGWCKFNGSISLILFIEGDKYGPYIFFIKEYIINMCDNTLLFCL